MDPPSDCARLPGLCNHSGQHCHLLHTGRRQVFIFLTVHMLSFSLHSCSLTVCHLVYWFLLVCSLSFSSLFLCFPVLLPVPTPNSNCLFLLIFPTSCFNCLFQVLPPCSPCSLLLLDLTTCSVVQDGMFLVVKYHIIRPPPACLGQAVK